MTLCCMLLIGGRHHGRSVVVPEADEQVELFHESPLGKAAPQVSLIYTGATVQIKDAYYRVGVFGERPSLAAVRELVESTKHPAFAFQKTVG